MPDSHYSRNRRPPQAKELPQPTGKEPCPELSLMCHKCHQEFDSLVAMTRHMEEAHMVPNRVERSG